MSALFPLLQRYARTWRQAVQAKSEKPAIEDLRHERQFLAPVLALQQTPPHPLPSVMQWSMLSVTVLALLWACVGKVDVIASATGKVVPSGRSKVIQPSETSVIAAIYVEDGQQVKRGQVLIALDDQATGADVARLQSDLLGARVDAVRATSMLETVETLQAPSLALDMLPNASLSQRKALERWLNGQYLELRSELDQSDADIERMTSEIRSASVAVSALQASLPIARQLADDYALLLQERAVAKHAFLEKEQTRLTQQRELDLQKSRMKELAAAKRATEFRRINVLAQYRRAMLDLQNEARQRAAALEHELSKAKTRHLQRQLLAPVDGTVQQLAVHTRGGVVTEAQPLMVIVPEDQPVEIEAMLDNKDIGFVKPGQEVQIKVETFTFTRFGILKGVVVSVSHDAIEDERRGLVYSSRIRLEESHIQVGESEVALSPGMAITAEIKTDRRTVISYFLSPLQQSINESIRER